eukprot:g20566.t1
MSGPSAWIEAAGQYISSLPLPLAALAATGLTAASTVSIVVSTSPINLLMGPMFGPVLGAVLFDAGATIGAIIAFLLGRYLLSAWATRKKNENELLRALDRALEKDAAKMIVLARLSPLFPFSILCYALGPTSVSLFTYTWATFVGNFPACLLYCWIGSSLQQVASGGGESQLSSYISIGIAVLSTVLVSSQAKKAFDQACQDTGSKLG